MLDHKTLRMTLVDARIADQAVSDAYDRVTDQVDAFYTKPTGLRSDGGGSASMARLGVEYDQRMLGNGCCNRPARLPVRINMRIMRPLHHRRPVQPSPPSPTGPRRGRRPTPRINLFQMLLNRNTPEATT